MNKKKLITKQGLVDLKEKLAGLEARRPKVIERVEAARQMGDLRENSEYHAAREDLVLLDTQINELKEILLNAKVVDKNKGSSSVSLESLVTIKNSQNKKINYHVVGEHESDPLRGKISYTSPLGQALMNKKVGDQVVVETPKGESKYEIVAIK
ncbi:MAG: greA1 [Microgenomates bacterium 39_6]|nr:MAG: greA1 [Microgenomates bacterium 39_6]